MGKDCGWEHPWAPALRWLWKDDAVGAVVEFLENTKVGGPYGTRMYQQALFQEMCIIAQKNGAKWSVHGMYMEMYMECIWNVYGNVYGMCMEMYMECTIMYILLIYIRAGCTFLWYTFGQDVHSCDIHSGKVHIWMGCTFW